MNPRRRALEVLRAVIGEGRSLTEALEGPLAEAGEADPRDVALLRALCFGVCRHYFHLRRLLGQLLDRPLRRKDRDVELAALLGLFQLGWMRIPAHAAVAETVALAGALRKPWARGLLNALLRRYQREREALEARVGEDEEAACDHPRWLLDRLRAAWPADWPAVVAANNSPAPMSLRVNLRQGDREDYLRQLAAAGIAARPAPATEAGIVLDAPVDVARLPGFAAGRVSVQDGAAQLAAPLLDARPGERVLDACAAPGGKTAHLLEREPALGEVVALDKSASRLATLEKGLARLGLSATTLAADAGAPADWWDGRPFHRILLDAPCSATGVIRRHPDIKLLRREADIPALVATQQTLLRRLWPLLRPGGILLYATCSVLPEENARQIAQFLQQCADARLAIDFHALPGVPPAPAGSGPALGRDTGHGWQILPGEADMDGFFYARLVKDG